MLSTFLVHSSVSSLSILLVLLGMFTCPKCLRRAIQGLSSDLSTSTSSPQSRRSLNFPLSSPIERLRIIHHGNSMVRPFQRRSAATMASLRKGHHRRVLKRTLASNPEAEDLYNKRRKAPLALTKVELNDALARAKNRALRTQSNEFDEDEDTIEEGDEDVRPSETNAESTGLTDNTKSKSARAEKVKLARLKRDVETYYKDPLQLANVVVEKLRVPDIDGALALVRASEPLKINNIVSWNHCMDWLMSQGEYKTSLKIYNEMKKRGHMPDAHTYTIMLSGLAQHAKSAGAVQEAVKMYNSMSAPNSTVKPNIIHTNAIINVCARGGDMETLWAVASKLPERGSGCPDRTTYTTILNALRENTIRKATSIADRANRQVKVEGASEERLALFKDALENGRKLWVDIGYRWRRADLVIDEQLVCAMGRLILGCGIGKDYEQVFDLVETTMNVRIPERRGRNQQQWLNENVENGEKADEGGEAQTQLPEISTDAHKLPLKESSVYATPGQNTLSMLLEASLLYKHRADLGKSYWHLLTKPDGRFRIQPDAGNILSYLRILRRTHSSHEVYQLLSKPWPDEVARNLFRRSTFIIAFASCARDKKNPNVFETARKLLSLCEERLEEQAVGMFDQRTGLNDMTYQQRKKALQQKKAEIKNMTEEELADYHRSDDGTLSMTTDPKLLRYFVELAVDTTKGWSEGIRGLDDGDVFERNPSKNHTMIALDTVGPSLPLLYQLLRSKLDEMQYGATKKYKKATDRRNSSSIKQTSQVGESIEELIALTRSMIAAYDKVLVIADRFERQKMDAIDPKHCRAYDRNKRQMHAHMTRIEATLRQKSREKSTKSDTNDLDKAADEEDDNPVPDIERKIRAVLEGVDGTWAGDAISVKPYERRQFGMKRESQPDRRVGGVSRKQKQVRSNLIEAGMKTQFGQQFSQTAGGDIAPVGGKTFESQRTETKKARNRPPMIGDELGLDDDEEDVDPTQQEFKSFVGKKPTPKRYIPFENQSQGESGSIAGNEQVRNTWEKAYAAAAAH